MSSNEFPRGRPPIVLASGSRYRRELLGRLGLAFDAEAPDCDEHAYKARGLGPEELAETLALAKARLIAERFPGATILGSDQVPAIDGRILDKPETVERAVEQLLLLNGREHRLITAVAVLSGDRLLQHTDVTRLSMRRLSRAQIERYVAADQPLDCAGSYRLESRGIALFSSIDSADHTAIIGLPLIAVTGMLAGLGYEIP
ncbi:MAG: nucleoside triphosphate pyrophosphatase [Minicystis sp.]